MLNNLISKLNPQQQEAVLHMSSPLLVVAGAGSGKTRIITYKIAYLCSELGVPPGRILALTFTNKAANEMRERVEKLTGLAEKSFHITTFHSLGASILREFGQLAGMGREWQIIDEKEQQAILKKIVAESGIRPGDLQYQIGNAKINLLYPQDREHLVEFGFSAEEIVLYEKYQEHLRQMKLWDFEDLISCSYLLLSNNSELQKSYSSRFSYILVDEYQDTNPNQYQLLKLLANDCRQIAVVGDDDQAIYSWRGARIEYLLNFESDFPGTRIIKLEQNYRTTPNIINLANRVISDNIKRHQKVMWTDNAAGCPPFFIKTITKEHEADEVIRFIQSLRSRHPGLLPAAILMRTNSQTMIFEKKLSENDISFRILRGIGFFQRKEIKDLLAALLFLNDPSSAIFFNRLARNFNIGIGEKTLERVSEMAEQQGISHWESFLVINGERELHRQLAALMKLFGAGLPPSKQLREIIAITEIKEKIEQKGEWEKWENILALQDFLENWEKEGREFNDLADLVNLNPSLGEKKGKSEVVLLTMHGSKGLEFPTVIVVGANSHFLPLCYFNRSIAQLEEERRLFYVSITRAQKLLLISQGGANPTAFLTAIGTHYLQTVYESHDVLKNIVRETSASELVDHPIFGRGTIVKSLSEKKVLVRFESGEKVIDLSIIKL